MSILPMKYKNYVWPHNPRVYGISFLRKVAVGKVPFGRYVMSDLGMTYRVLRGEGEFCGEDAYDKFKELATVFYDDGPGRLWHPIWQESNAYFVKLSLRQEPLPNYVAYEFEFWEAYDRYSTEPTAVKKADKKAALSERKTHTVAEGDTLWAIAERNGMTLGEVIALNPQIKNPNLIRAGQSIFLS